MADQRSCRQWVRFAGRVQGVGFRYSTCRVASGFQVTGFVRNLQDGGVELVAEGSEAELDAFVEELQRVMSGYIQSVDVHRLAATGEFDEFAVRH